MTRGELIRELNKYLEAEKDYESARLALEECENMIMRVSVNYDSPRVQTSPEPDKLGNVIDRLIKLRRGFIDAADEAARTMERTFGLIQRVREPNGRRVLTRRYISGETWDEIGRGVSYSWSGVHKVHDRAIDELLKSE